MIRLFLQNLFVTNLLLIPYLVVLRISSFVNPPDYSELEGYSLLSDLLYKLPSFALSVIAVFLIFLQANIIINFSNFNKLNSKNNQLAGLIYCLGMSMIPNFLTLHPIIIANTFILLMLAELTNIYKTYKPIKSLFMGGFYLGLAVLFCRHYIFMFLFIVQSLLILRDINFREFFQSLSGFLVPLFLYKVVTSFFVSENFWNLNLYIKQPNTDFSFGIRQWICIGLFICSLIFILINQNNIRKKKSIKAQKIIRMLFILMLYSLPLLFFTSAQTVHHTCFLMISLSMLYAIYIAVSKKVLIAEFAHLLFVILILLMQFQIL